jgi:hypothetical protein
VPWFLTCDASSKEGFKCQIDTHSDVLKHLGMDTTKLGALFFQQRIGRLLTIAGTSASPLAPMRSYASQASDYRASHTLQASSEASAVVSWSGMSDI